MDSKLVRRKFLEFFENKQHQIVDSAPLVNKDDPTLMFTNAGMNQFKDYFLGNKKPQYNRVADTQKCLRVSGKHNDLEEVGLDTYHHTMFEMLGNWSFGDYFKKEAIAWAWELLTEVYGLPKDRLYVTVFGGDEGDKLDVDQEAYDYWKEIIDEDKILYGSKDDNFWEMGDTGPCGPCSEIHIDLRTPEEIEKKPGKDLVNQDDPQVVEIWNLVFMEFNRQASGELKNLPAKHVDTGMGFERLCMAIQKKSSNYDTDVFTPLISFLSEKAGIKYGVDKQIDIAIRVISDHVRAIAFAITDGQLPSNTGAGYVIRRILRRAVRYGFTFLDFKKPFIYELVPILVDQFADVFPELKSQKDFVMKAIEQEELSFLRTLDAGLIILDRSLVTEAEISLIKTLQENGVIVEKPKVTSWSSPDLILPEYKFGIELRGMEGSSIDAEKWIDDQLIKILSIETLTKADLGKILKVDKLRGVNFEFYNKMAGDIAFQLYDTHGFPFDLTKLIAKEKGWEIDEEGFKAEMQKQKTRSKADAAKETGDWNVVGDQENVEFIGYEHLVAEAKLVKYRTIKQKGKEIYQIVLDKTPFYAESGGQVGDQGYLEGNGEKISVLDTKKENDLIVHFTDKLPSNLEGSYKAVVSEKKRKLTMSNHSATHLLHAALRSVLGEHVEQKGSLVNDKVLRFDFSHFQKMTDEELAKVEHIVNEKIRENIPLDERRNVPLEEAKKLGAMALFGEKYGEFVRVITFDQDYSVELCGGTHVAATGNIGFFKIVSESSIAAGVRRIEAITSEAAEKYIDEQFALVDELKELLKNPKDIKAAVHSLVEQKNKLEKEIEKLHAGQAQGIKKELLGKVKPVEGANVIIEKITVPAGDALKNLSFELKNEVENLFMVLAADIDGKPQIAVVIGDNLLKEKDLNAGNIVRELAKEIKGGGGGQPFFATAGGKDINGLDKVLEKAISYLK